MREIKFKVWNKKEKRWFEPQEYPEIVVDTLGRLLAPMDCELVEFTGLLDKNGKEIYEGDLLKDRWGHLLKVVYSPCSFMAVDPSHGLQFEGSELDALIDSYDNKKGEFTFIEKREDFEVIGNIYENPELVK